MKALATAQAAARAFTNRDIEHDAAGDDVYLNTIAAFSLLAIAECAESIDSSLRNMERRT